MIVEKTIFEGTLSEILAIQQARARDSGSPEIHAPEPDLNIVNEDTIAGQDSSYRHAHERTPVSTKIAYRVLTRISLSKEQRQILVMLYQRHPDWVWADELQDCIGYSTSRFAGLMGAFGRRLTHTPGYADPSWLFEIEWDAGKGCNRYRLPESVRRAVEQAGLV